MRAEAFSMDARRFLVVGLGCERGTPPAELIELARSVVSRPEDVAFVATLDMRADEPAMHAVAGHFAVPLVTFPADRLEAETPRLANPSAVVFAHAGCHGVAEAAALAKAGAHARLVVEKTKSAHATVAIAESHQGLAPSSLESDSLSSSIDSSRGGA